MGLKPKYLVMCLLGALTVSGNAFATEGVTSVSTLPAQGATCQVGQLAMCYPVILGQVAKDSAQMNIWQNIEVKKELFLQLKAVANSDLLPGMAQRIHQLVKLDDAQNTQEFNHLAADTFLIYLNFVHQVQKSPSVLFDPKPVALSPLTLAEATPYFPMTLAKLETLRPEPAHFLETMRLIELLDQLPVNPLSARDFPYAFRAGNAMPTGKTIAQVLYDLGDMTKADFDTLESQPEITNTGIMNNAIRHFQARNGLVVDGILGGKSARILRTPYHELARVVALNLQRERMTRLSQNPDRAHILVNVPDFDLKIFQDNKVVFESRVIVGRPARPTNLFSSRINTMVVNPTWNVPQTIKVQDIIPKLQKNPAYLKEHNLTVLKSWRNRVPVEQEIDWKTVDPKTFPYEFQQGPGKFNSLGNVKFLMPNGYSIFLHDTPSRGLFQRTERDLSSGCVRVQKAADLAKFVIKYQDSKKIPTYDVLLSDEKQDTIPLHKRLNVDFVYLTAWLDETGHLQMRQDIYGYDTPRESPVDGKFVSMRNYRA